MAIKVLIIEEQSNQNEIFKDLRSRGFSVDKTSYDKKLGNNLQNFNPDVIIMDSHQPDRNKETPYWSLREISKAPIVVLSVVDEPGIVEKVLDLGADEYLLKPVSPKLLVARINALARRSYNQNLNRRAKSKIVTSPLSKQF